MQCIGRIKPYHRLSRCHNDCKFFLCHQHRFQPLKLLVSLAALFVTLYSAYSIFWDEKPITKTEMELLIEQRFKAFIVPDFDSEESYPGVTVGMLVELVPQPQYRRKYLFDLAESLNKNRVSLFLDPNNILVFELIDDNGEVYNVKIPQSEYPFNEWIILYCEYGQTNEFSFLRIFVENKLVEQHKFRFKINLPIDFKENMSIAADVLGLNNAALTIAYNHGGHITLGKTKRRGFFNSIKYLVKKMNHPYGKKEYFN